MIIRFDRSPRQPVALFVAPWHDAAGRKQPGHAVGWLGADGEFYGARDVHAGTDHDAILAAWRSKARSLGLPVLELPDAHP